MSKKADSAAEKTQEAKTKEEQPEEEKTEEENVKEEKTKDEQVTEERVKEEKVEEEKTNGEKVKEEYMSIQRKKFDLSNLQLFKLSDFADASVKNFESRRRQGVKGRLLHVLSMPWGVMRHTQLDIVYASERCILWRAQLEQVVRATGMSYAITIFAIPFIGPFLGKAFMYFQEVPAWMTVGNEDAAGKYSFKQAPMDTDDWVDKGSQGVVPSNNLKVMWVCNLLKAAILFSSSWDPSTFCLAQSRSTSWRSSSIHSSQRRRELGRLAPTCWPPGSRRSTRRKKRRRSSVLTPRGERRPRRSKRR